MILEVQHETRLDYSEPVVEWLAEVRMQPLSDERQNCHSFHLILSEPAPVSCYWDGFGNRVHHFNFLAPRRQVRVLAASVVETNEIVADLSQCDAEFPVAIDAEHFQLCDYLSFRGPVCDTPLLAPLLADLAPHAGERVAAWVARVGRSIHERFEYARDVTDSSSPIGALLSAGKGVCQDFAHLMIAVLRARGVPARYVSGYVHRPNKESQSHAWCETWLPGAAWVGFDPTNGCQVDSRFVRVAVGRDFTDVPPNKGVHRGRGREEISVRVATRELRRLPSLSWHERLPPLDVPLTALMRHPPAAVVDEQVQQQQQ